MASRPLGANDPRDGKQKQCYLGRIGSETDRLARLQAFLSALIFVLPGMGRVGTDGDSPTGSLGSTKRELSAFLDSLQQGSE